MVGWDLPRMVTLFMDLCNFVDLATHRRDRIDLNGVTMQGSVG